MKVERGKWLSAEPWYLRLHRAKGWVAGGGKRGPYFWGCASSRKKLRSRD